MKKTGNTFLAFLLLLTIWACQTEIPMSAGQPVCDTYDEGALINVGPNISISKTEVVISINDKIELKNPEEFTRMQDTVLAHFGYQRSDLDSGKVTFETCECGDLSKQLWTFPEDILNIETSVGGLQGGPGGGHVEGDLQFTITLPAEGNGIAVNPEADESPRDYIKEDGKVNIAVLDTGLDLTRMENDKVLFLNPTGLRFLNSKGEAIECGPGMSGWNFVDNSSDIRDDHAMVGHGTLVTKTIMNSIDSGVDYRILPLKVFNHKGEGTYWDIVCALNYLKNVQIQTEGAIKIVNASFGGSLGNAMEDRIDILKSCIDDLRETAVVVTSAGNCHFNTDLIHYQHYPSGISSDNILAVGGYDEAGERIVLNDTSNYGNYNIDVAANFNQTLDLDIDGDGTLDNIKLSGTSYSAAYISAKLANKLAGTPNLAGPATDWKDTFTSAQTSISSDLQPYIANGRYVK